MPKLKFSVKIPNPDIEEHDPSNPEHYAQKLFYSVQEVCDFLKITRNTYNTLRSNRLKCKHKSKKILEGIIIENYTEEKTSDVVTKETYQRNLFNLIKNESK